MCVHQASEVATLSAANRRFEADKARLKTKLKELAAVVAAVQVSISVCVRVCMCVCVCVQRSWLQWWQPCRYECVSVCRHVLVQSEIHRTCEAEMIDPSCPDVCACVCVCVCVCACVCVQADRDRAHEGMTREIAAHHATQVRRLPRSLHITSLHGACMS